MRCHKTFHTIVTQKLEHLQCLSVKHIFLSGIHKWGWSWGLISYNVRGPRVCRIYIFSLHTKCFVYFSHTSHSGGEKINKNLVWSYAETLTGSCLQHPSYFMTTFSISVQVATLLMYVFDKKKRKSIRQEFIIPQRWSRTSVKKTSFIRIQRCAPISDHTKGQCYIKVIFARHLKNVCLSYGLYLIEFWHGHYSSGIRSNGKGRSRLFISFS